MDVDEGMVAGAEAESVRTNWERAVDILASRLKTHIGDDAEWLNKFDGLPDLKPEEINNDAPQLEAVTTLFAVWWRAQAGVL